MVFHIWKAISELDFMYVLHRIATLLKANVKGSSLVWVCLQFLNVRRPSHRSPYIDWFNRVFGLWFSMATLDQLPIDVHHLIFGYLNLIEIFTYRLVSKKFNEIVKAFRVRELSFYSSKLEELPGIMTTSPSTRATSWATAKCLFWAAHRSKF